MEEPRDERDTHDYVLCPQSEEGPAEKTPTGEGKVNRTCFCKTVRETPKSSEGKK